MSASAHIVIKVERCLGPNKLILRKTNLKVSKLNEENKQTDVVSS